MGLLGNLRNALRPKNIGVSEQQKESFNKPQADNSSINEDNLALTSPIRFIGKYANPFTIQHAIEVNPNIKRILEEENLPVEFNIQNFNSIIMSHLIPTSKTTQKIYLNMGHKKEDADYLRLTQAALLHDIGKVFIPSGILNKKGRLTPAERKIVELHNRLSYEVIKTTNLNQKVAQFALEHHNYSKKVVSNHENQALTIADVYCALREARPYKKPYSDIAAKTILYDMGAKGQLDSRYISCLF